MISSSAWTGRPKPDPYRGEYRTCGPFSRFRWEGVVICRAWKIELAGIGFRWWFTWLGWRP